jgi:N-acetylmuramoyl-L-alanine amidase
MTPQETAARTAWGEARSEGSTGMQAVLNVIAARVAEPGWWGHDIAGVCQAQSHGVHHFSCWNASDPNRAQLLAVTDEDPIYRAALSLAGRLTAGTLENIVRGADSYYRVGSNSPAWATGRRYLLTLGRHAFYRVGVDGHAVAARPQVVIS